MVDVSVSRFNKEKPQKSQRNMETTEGRSGTTRPHGSPTGTLGLVPGSRRQRILFSFLLSLRSRKSCLVRCVPFPRRRALSQVLTESLTSHGRLPSHNVSLRGRTAGDATAWTGSGWDGAGPWRGRGQRSEGGARDGVELLHQPLQARHLLGQVVLFVHLEDSSH